MANYKSAYNSVCAERDALQARLAAVEASAAEYREAALGLTNHLHHGVCDSMQYLDQPDCACGLKAKMARLLSREPGALGREIVEAARELVASIDDESEWQSGPNQQQYDRQVAALDRLRALLPAREGE